MKTLRWQLITFLGLLAFTAFPILSRPPVEPYAEIKSVLLQGTNVVVEVEASTSFTRITLESSTRVGRRTWEPRAVHHLEPNLSDVANFTFTVPISPAMEVLRVRGDMTSAMPTTFYEGTNEFVSGTGSGGGRGEFGAPGDVSAGPEAGDSGENDNRTVVESDIWKLHEDTLFFFNQYRGLQVLDVSDPDAPVLTGTYDIPAAGEQMYVIDGTKVVLLARDTCSWYGDSSESRVILLDASSGEPQFVGQLPVSGYIVESRLVGDALYVVANSYRQRPAPSGQDTSTVWEWGSDIHSFDLADFNAPVARSSDSVAGYNNVIMATDRFLLVAQYQYSSSRDVASNLHIYDISNPDGTFEKLAVTRTLGIVQDKFKMNISGDVLSVVSRQDSAPNRPTMLETFSLADPRNPARIGSLKIIENEQLHATRFYGDLLYVVTFMQIDPLWIIDLSDPASPEIVGELEIPGWSTFIHPMPGQLLTIGLDNTAGWRTSVQLFDVSDPADPTLASKVLIGDSYSGSEANQDEKAFQVIPQENLVLVPFHGNVGDDWINGVQIIDLFETELVKRGIIEQDFQPRRATLHRERILSISARELLTVDVTDRDNPEIVSSTTLSWATDRLHLVGDYLLEIDSYSSGTPSIRIVSSAATSDELNHVDLGELPYLGSTVADGKLFVLQGRSREVIYPDVWNPTNWFPIKTNAGLISIAAYDLSALPEVTLIGEASQANETDYLYGQFSALQVSDDVLVWVNTQSYGWPWWWDMPVMAMDARGAPAGAALSDIAMPYYWWGGNQGLFIAVDIGGESPEIASTVRLSGTNGWWNFSDSYTDNGLLYTSHLASEFDPEFDPPPYTYQTYDNGKLVTVTNDPPKGSYVQRYYLDVIDFNDPYDPLLRKPVNIPGSLIGIHQDGELLYTRGQDLSLNYWGGGNETLSASAYDGVQASLIDSMIVSNRWPKPALALNGFIYLGNPGADEIKPAIELWTIGSEGKFTLANSVEVEVAANQFASYGDLLVAQTSKIVLFDASDPMMLEQIGSGTAQACYGVVLNGGDGNVQRGLWLPLGWYGVIHIPPDPVIDGE